MDSKLSRSGIGYQIMRNTYCAWYLGWQSSWTGSSSPSSHWWSLLKRVHSEVSGERRAHVLSPTKGGSQLSLWPQTPPSPNQPGSYWPMALQSKTALAKMLGDPPTPEICFPSRKNFSKSRWKSFKIYLNISIGHNGIVTWTTLLSLHLLSRHIWTTSRKSDEISKTSLGNPQVTDKPQGSALR